MGAKLSFQHHSGPVQLLCLKQLRRVLQLSPRMVFSSPTLRLSQPDQRLIRVSTLLKEFMTSTKKENGEWRMERLDTLIAENKNMCN